METIGLEEKDDKLQGDVYPCTQRTHTYTSPFMHICPWKVSYNYTC